MADNMAGLWFGPMPVDDFLNEFVPLSEGMDPAPQYSHLFAVLRQEKAESKMYAPFINLLEKKSLIPGFNLMDTSNADINSRRGKKIKPDPSMYRKEVDISSNITQFDKIELRFEFKVSGYDPLVDPPGDMNRTEFQFEASTATGTYCRGQLTSYVAEWFVRQHRTSGFTIFIPGSKARLIHWNRSHAVVTKLWDYKKNSQPLVNFLWFVHLDDEGRGMNTTVRIANEEPLVKEYLSKWKKHHDRPVVIFTVDDNGSKWEFVGRHSIADPESLTGRTTRGYSVFERETSIIAFLKDSWRGVDLNPESKLNEAGVRKVPIILCGGDIKQHKTHCTNSKETWVCGTNRFTPIIQHRFVEDLVGVPLDKFESTKEFMRVVYDAFVAHQKAYEKCNILHGDISVSNILMRPEGGGMLNDWDLAEVVPNETETPRNHERTGTWQFISALNLMQPGKCRVVQDDMESFVYVVLHHSLRFIQHPMLHKLPDLLTSIFDGFTQRADGAFTGGVGKCLFFLKPTSHLGPNFKFTRNEPLTRWLTNAINAVRQWHSFADLDSEPEPDFKFQVNPPQAPPTYDELIFKDHNMFREMWAEILEHGGWPTCNDRAFDYLNMSLKASAQPSKRSHQESDDDDFLPLNKKRRSTRR